MNLPQFFILLPEISLTIIAVLMQLIAVFYKQNSRIIAGMTVNLLCLLGLYLSYNHNVVSNISFNDSFEVNNFTSLFKLLTLFLAIASIIIYQGLSQINNKAIRFEFITLIMLSTLGIFVSISARDLLLLFCGLELQALSGYALAAFNQDNSRSAEAGLRYFILGGLVSCLGIFGMSFLYGYGGSIKFVEIGHALSSTNNIAMVVGAIFLFASILFKLSAAPLHIWTPDVYEGAPIASVSYFATAQKIGILIVLLNLVQILVGDYTPLSVSLIRVVAILSMIVGAFGAILQTSLKRLMGYSAILNGGYVLIGVCLHSRSGYNAAILYMVIYAVSVLGFFACLVSLLGGNADAATFSDLSGASSNRKTLAAVISILMFSMIGIPPFAGFWGKYYLFYQAIKHGELGLALIGVFTSVVAAFYYLKVIKAMYFSGDENKITIIPTNNGLLLVSMIVVGFVLCFAFIPSYHTDLVT